MPEAQAAVAQQVRAADTYDKRSKPNPRGFAVLVLQLTLLLSVFKIYRLEQPVFFTLACLVFGGFAVSYWLPFRFKQDFQILLSLGGAYVLLSPVVASLLIVTGMALFAVIRSPLEFRWKLALLLGMLGGLAYVRSTGIVVAAQDFWPVFGAMFMFRMIVYLYDLKHQTGPARLKEYLGYFFLLPNYYFMLFPVIDFQTFRKSYFQRDFHPIAQQGIWWIVRGTTHLLLYRFIYQLQVNFSPPKVPVLVGVIGKMVLCFLLYLRVSGQFHIITGMLRLFGYDLPETNHRYLLSSSLNDSWRRMNIYWKDFMVKVVYFPVFFMLRRGGELRAQILATVAVFFTTWFLHAYQFFWLQNKFRLTLNDTLFWTVLGSAVMVEILVQRKRRKHPPRSGILPKLQHALQIALTIGFLSVLWSMWSAGGLEEWFNFLKTGNI